MSARRPQSARFGRGRPHTDELLGRGIVLETARKALSGAKPSRAFRVARPGLGLKREPASSSVAHRADGNLVLQITLAALLLNAPPAAAVLPRSQ